MHPSCVFIFLRKFFYIFLILIISIFGTPSFTIFATSVQENIQNNNLISNNLETAKEELEKNQNIINNALNEIEKLNKSEEIAKQIEIKKEEINELFENSIEKVEILSETKNNSSVIGIVNEIKSTPKETQIIATAKVVNAITNKENLLENENFNDIANNENEKLQALETVNTQIKDGNKINFLAKTLEKEDIVSVKVKLFDPYVNIEKLYEEDNYNIFRITINENSIFKTEILDQIENGIYPDNFLKLEIIKPEVFRIENILFEGENYESLGHLKNLGIEKLYEINDSVENLPEVKIGVIDTGIDFNHPDLKNNFLYGKNFIDSSKNSFDDQGHGTHVSGIIAGSLNNSGIFGVNPNAKIISLKICDQNGFCPSNAIVEAIEFAKTENIEILNLSLGGKSDPANHVVCTALNSFSANGVAIVAAGNGNTNVNNYVPGGCNNVISVGSVSEDLSKSRFSNFGDITISTFGENINSSYPSQKGNFKTLSGTSMSAPIITGITSIILQTKKSENVNYKLEIQELEEFLNIGNFGSGNSESPNVVNFNAILENLFLENDEGKIDENILPEIENASEDSEDEKMSEELNEENFTSNSENIIDENIFLPEDWNDENLEENGNIIKINSRNEEDKLNKKISIFELSEELKLQNNFDFLEISSNEDIEEFDNTQVVQLNEENVVENLTGEEKNVFLEEIENETFELIETKELPEYLKNNNLEINSSEDLNNLKSLEESGNFKIIKNLNELKELENEFNSGNNIITESKNIPNYANLIPIEIKELLPEENIEINSEEIGKEIIIGDEIEDEFIPEGEIFSAEFVNSEKLIEDLENDGWKIVENSENIEEELELFEDIKIDENEIIIEGEIPKLEENIEVQNDENGGIREFSNEEFLEINSFIQVEEGNEIKSMEEFEIDLQNLKNEGKKLNSKPFITRSFLLGQNKKSAFVNISKIYNYKVYGDVDDFISFEQEGYYFKEIHFIPKRSGLIKAKILAFDNSNSYAEYDIYIYSREGEIKIIPKNISEFNVSDFSGFLLRDLNVWHWQGNEYKQSFSQFSEFEIFSDDLENLEINQTFFESGSLNLIFKAKKVGNYNIKVLTRIQDDSLTSQTKIIYNINLTSHKQLVDYEVKTGADFENIGRGKTITNSTINDIFKLHIGTGIGIDLGNETGFQIYSDKEIEIRKTALTGNNLKINGKENGRINLKILTNSGKYYKFVIDAFEIQKPNNLSCEIGKYEKCEFEFISPSQVYHTNLLTTSINSIYPSIGGNSGYGNTFYVNTKETKKDNNEIVHSVLISVTSYSVSPTITVDMGGQRIANIPVKIYDKEPDEIIKVDAGLYSRNSNISYCGVLPTNYGSVLHDYQIQASNIISYSGTCLRVHVDMPTESKIRLYVRDNNYNVIKIIDFVSKFRESPLIEDRTITPINTINGVGQLYLFYEKSGVEWTSKNGNTKITTRGSAHDGIEITGLYGGYDEIHVKSGDILVRIIKVFVEGPPKLQTFNCELQVGSNKNCSFDIGDLNTFTIRSGNTNLVNIFSGGSKIHINSKQLSGSTRLELYRGNYKFYEININIGVPTVVDNYCTNYTNSYCILGIPNFSSYSKEIYLQKGYVSDIYFNSDNNILKLTSRKPTKGEIYLRDSFGYLRYKINIHFYDYLGNYSKYVGEDFYLNLSNPGNYNIYGNTGINVVYSNNHGITFRGVTPGFYKIFLEGKSNNYSDKLIEFEIKGVPSFLGEYNCNIKEFEFCDTNISLANVDYKSVDLDGRGNLISTDNPRIIKLLQNNRVNLQVIGIEEGNTQITLRKDGYIIGKVNVNISPNYGNIDLLGQDGNNNCLGLPRQGECHINIINPHLYEIKSIPENLIFRGNPYEVKVTNFPDSYIRLYGQTPGIGQIQFWRNGSLRHSLNVSVTEDIVYRFYDDPTLPPQPLIVSTPIVKLNIGERAFISVNGGTAPFKWRKDNLNIDILTDDSDWKKSNILIEGVNSGTSIIKVTDAKGQEKFIKVCVGVDGCESDDSSGNENSEENESENDDSNEENYFPRLEGLIYSESINSEEDIWSAMFKVSGNYESIGVSFTDESNILQSEDLEKEEDGVYWIAFSQKTCNNCNNFRIFVYKDGEKIFLNSNYLVVDYSGVTVANEGNNEIEINTAFSSGTWINGLPSEIQKLIYKDINKYEKAVVQIKNQTKEFINDQQGYIDGTSLAIGEAFMDLIKTPEDFINLLSSTASIIAGYWNGTRTPEQDFENAKAAFGASLVIIETAYNEFKLYKQYLTSYNIKFVQAYVGTSLALSTAGPGKLKGAKSANRVAKKVDQIVSLGKVAKVTAETLLISQKISNGHAFTKHIVEFQSLGIGTIDDLQKKIEQIIKKSNGTKNMKIGSNSRIAFWDDVDSIIIIYDPKSPDLGTTFIPKDGKNYFNNFK